MAVPVPVQRYLQACRRIGVSPTRQVVAVIKACCHSNTDSHRLLLQRTHLGKLGTKALAVGIMVSRPMPSIIHFCKIYFDLSLDQHYKSAKNPFFFHVS